MSVLSTMLRPSLSSRRHADRRLASTTHTDNKRSLFPLCRYTTNCIFLSTLLFSVGCGVNTALIPALSLSASTTTLAPSQTVSIMIHGDGTGQIPVTLTMSCKAPSCGTLAHHQYKAPTDLTATLSVAIKAVNTYFPQQSATMTLTVYPVPAITAVTPGYIIAGTTSTLILSGSGFAAGSHLSISTQDNIDVPSLSSAKITSPTSITAQVVVPPHASGVFTITVRSPLPSIQQAHSQSLYIYPDDVAADPTLPILNVLAYHASGSSTNYSCSGRADNNILECAGGSTDFLPGEGIRIVGAGNTPAVQAISSITVTKHGGATGDHIYCYMLFRADAAGGITEGSSPSCVSQEPSTLSYRGTYNTFTASPNMPLSTFLWYRSEDYGPYYLFSVNGTMDVGQQPRSFGGWPLSLPNRTDDISKREDLFATVLSVHGGNIVLDRPLCATVHNTLVDHDDSSAIQTAITAASDMGGADIFLPPGTYNLRLPQFQARPNSPGPYFSFTTDYNYRYAYVWSTWSFLTIPPGSRGNIHFIGSGKSTILQLPPNSGGQAELIQFDPMPHPAYSPFKALGIEPVSKGSLTVTLTSAPPPSLKAGTDIWMYSGSFDNGNAPACINTDGTAGGNCHHSEVNTVVSTKGRTLQLKYPTSKEYYDDGRNSFGIVPLPTCVHNISLSDITINANNRIIGVGVLYGLLVNHVTVNGRIAHGVFSGGPKRDVVIQDSSWEIGEGDVSWLGTAEFDQAVGVALLHDNVTGFAAVGAEGPSMNARIYFTEGSSDIYLFDDTFNHVSVYIQESADDFLENNVFHDGNVAVGYSYVPNSYPHSQAPPRSLAFLSFGPQGTALVENNTFTMDSNFTPPWGILVGHYQHAVVSGNTINAADHIGGGAAIMAFSGIVEKNTVTVDHGRSSAVGILVIPDYGPGVPFSSLTVVGNNVNIEGESTPTGIGLVGPTVLDPEKVCIKGNQVNVGRGTDLYIWNKDDVILGCD